MTDGVPVLGGAGRYAELDYQGSALVMTALQGDSDALEEARHEMIRAAPWHWSTPDEHANQQQHRPCEVISNAADHERTRAG